MKILQMFHKIIFVHKIGSPKLGVKIGSQKLVDKIVHFFVPQNFKTKIFKKKFLKKNYYENFTNVGTQNWSTKL